MKLKNLTSDLQLGLRLMFLEPIKKLLAEPGHVTFAKNFFAEGLLPTSRAERAMLDEASKCIGCGLCDAAPGAGPRPSLIATTFSKASADLAHLGALSVLTEERLEAAEALCPERVPLVRLRRFLEERRAEVTAQEAAPLQAG